MLQGTFRSFINPEEVRVDARRGTRNTPQHQQAPASSRYMHGTTELDVMGRIRSTSTTFGSKDKCRRRRRRRCFSGPSHDAQSKYSHHSSGSSAHSTARTASGTVTAAMMVVLAVTLLGASAPRVVSAGWIDPDTPQEAMTTLSLVDNTEYELVS